MLITYSFDVVGANAAAGTLTGGCSSLPRTAMSHVNALAFDLAKKGLSFGSRARVLVGVENYDIKARGSSANIPRVSLGRPWKARGDRESPILHELKASFTLHMAIRTDDADASPRALLQTALPTMSSRFGGGATFPSPRRADGFSIIEGDGNLDDWLSARRQVQFIAHTPELLTEYAQPSDQDALDTLIHLLAIHREQEASPESDDEQAEEKPAPKQQWRHIAPGWLIPLEIGYAGCHTPVTGRPQTRDSSAPSVVTTPLITLGKFISGSRLLRERNRGIAPKVFWQSNTDLPNNFFYLDAFTN